MKKYALLIIALFTTLSMFSQKTYRALGWKLSRDLPQNELKLNLGTSIIGSFPEITYERILNADLSVGASLGVSLEEDRYVTDFLFSPYVRWFFGGNSENLRKYGAGFFIEANGGIFNVYEDGDYYDGYTSVDIENKVMGAGLGLAAGWKYISQNNWVGEVYFGGGRDLINDGAYPRMGLTIGKRF
ncbi:MAG TPA: hypothetical protein VKX35_06145 [Fermentimonas sp.]|nr:hypothetical protein [Fermentimonas sp.]